MCCLPTHGNSWPYGSKGHTRAKQGSTGRRHGSSMKHPLTSTTLLLPLPPTTRVNAAKALLVVKNRPFTQLHGVSGQLAQARPRLSTNTSFSSSPALSPNCVGTLATPLTQGDRITLYDALYNLPFIHRAFTLTFRAAVDLYLPIVEPIYCRKDGSSEAWFSAYVDPKNVTKNLAAVLPKGFEIDKGFHDQCVIREKARSKWEGRAKSRTADISHLIAYHSRTRRHVVSVLASRPLVPLRGSRAIPLTQQVPTPPHACHTSSPQRAFKVCTIVPLEAPRVPTQLAAHRVSKSSVQLNSSSRWLARSPAWNSSSHTPSVHARPNYSLEPMRLSHQGDRALASRLVGHRIEVVPAARHRSRHLGRRYAADARGSVVSPRVSVKPRRRRPRIPTAIQDQVIVTSRRRCCLCFYLRDLRENKRDRSRIWIMIQPTMCSGILVYLCLGHHDEFDSVPRQSKALTSGEVREYRDRPYRHFRVKAHPQSASTLASYQSPQTPRAAPGKIVHLGTHTPFFRQPWKMMLPEGSITSSLRIQVKEPFRRGLPPPVPESRRRQGSRPHRTNRRQSRNEHNQRGRGHRGSGL